MRSIVLPGADSVVGRKAARPRLKRGDMRINHGKRLPIPDSVLVCKRFGVSWPFSSPFPQFIFCPTRLHRFA